MVIAQTVMCFGKVQIGCEVNSFKTVSHVLWISIVLCLVTRMTSSFFTKSQEEHTHHVQQALQRLLENKLFIKVLKREFHSAFLAFVIANRQVRADPSFPLQV